MCSLKCVCVCVCVLGVLLCYQVFCVTTNEYESTWKSQQVPKILLVLWCHTLNLSLQCTMGA